MLGEDVRKIMCYDDSNILKVKSEKLDKLVSHMKNNTWDENIMDVKSFYYTVALYDDIWDIYVNEICDISGVDHMDTLWDMRLQVLNLKISPLINISDVVPYMLKAHQLVDPDVTLRVYENKEVYKMNNKYDIHFPVKYINGNYQVTILEDGTKFRLSATDVFTPKRPETLDVNISNHCENNCPFCYISATDKGSHGDLDMPMFNTLKAYTEIAINFAKHPNLREFLEKMRTQRVIVNMTINMIDFNDEETVKLINDLISDKLIYGLGISVSSKIDVSEILAKINGYKRVVFHVIAGITKFNTISNIVRDGHSVLILGFKSKGRGVKIAPDLDDLRNNLSTLLGSSIISFDNLALKQLNVKSYLSEDEWDMHFMGEEGQFSMYVDTVDQKFYTSSTETNGHNINNMSVSDMFRTIGEINDIKN